MATGKATHFEPKAVPQTIATVPFEESTRVATIAQDMGYRVNLHPRRIYGSDLWTCHVNVVIEGLDKPLDLMSNNPLVREVISLRLPELWAVIQNGSFSTQEENESN